MLKKFVYNFLKQVAKACVFLYFSKIEINGIEKVPTGDNPIIFAPNHQGAFMDAVIVGVLSPIPVFYLTRSDVFKPATNWFLSALNMMPIYRIRDGYASLSKNEAIFETCKNLLLEDKQILIFPEGNHAETHYLRPITKGISRIALNSQLENPKDIIVVPVGINYFHHTRSGNKLILNYGESINVQDFLPENKEIKPRDLNDFRKEVVRKMQACLVLSTDENYEKRKHIFNRKNENIEFDALKVFAEKEERLETEKIHGWAKLVSLLLLIPNFPAFLLYYWVEKNKIGQVAFISSIKIAFGMFVFPTWLLISTLLIGLLMSWQVAWTVCAVQIISFLVRRYVVRYTS